MRAFFFTARDESGRRTGGVVLVSTGRDIWGELKEKKVYVDGLWPLPAPFASRGLTFLGRMLKMGRRKAGRRDLAVFSRQLSAMLGSGVPLLKCLDVLGRQCASRPLKTALAEMSRQIKRGTGLAAAVRQTAAFPPLFADLIEVGEAGGLLDEVVEELAVHFERELYLWERVKSALCYPAFVVAFSLVAAAVTVLGVLPVMASVLAGLGLELPLAGRIVLGAARTFFNAWPAGAAGALAAAAAVRAALKSPAGRRFGELRMLGAPLVGPLWKKVLAARFCRTAGMLLKSGAALLPALDTVRRTCGSAVLGAAVADMQKGVSEGRELAGLMNGSGFFSPLAVQLVSAGEEAGTLDEMLGRAARYTEAEVEAAVTRLVSLAEPVTVAAAGLLVGLVVFSVMLPLFNLVAALE